MIYSTNLRHKVSTVLKSVLELAVLAVFFIGPTYTQLSGDWLPPLYRGVFAIIVPIYITVILWLLLGLPGLNQALRDSRRWWMFGLLALLVWGWLSRLWSLYPDKTSSTAGAFATIGLFTWAATCTGVSPRRVCIALTAGLFVQAVIAVAQVSIQHPLGLVGLGEYQLKPLNVGLSIVVAGTERLMRPYGLTSHPNTLAGYLAFALVAMSGWLTTKSKRWRYIQLGIFILGLWSLWLSFSRAAWGAFVVGLISLCIQWWIKRINTVPRCRLLSVAVTGILVTIVFFLVYNRFVLARTINSDEITELRSTSDRRYYAGIALQSIYEHPLLGLGLDSFPDFAGTVIHQSPYAGYMEGDYVHNVPLLVWSELGLIGFLVWLFALIVWFVVVWKKVSDPFAIGLASGVIVLLAASMLDHYIWSMPHFITLLWASMGISLSEAINSSAGEFPAESVG